MTCWNESFNNKIIGKQTCLYLLGCAIFGLYKFYKIQQKRKNATEIMCAIAIKRAFTAVSLAWYEFQTSHGIFKFSNLGTMLQEHYHAFIRAMAKGVDTIENIINCIIRSNILFEIHERHSPIVSG